MKPLLISLLAIYLTACTATGPAFTRAAAPPEGSALVYLYRLNSNSFGFRKAKFFIDDVHVADLNALGYTWLHVPAGNHTLTQRWPLDTMTQKIGGPVKLAAGRTYYFRLWVGATYSETLWQLAPQPPTTALREMEDCQYQAAAADTGS